jgi:hypothetical protein
LLGILDCNQYEVSCNSDMSEKQKTSDMFL